MNTQYVVFDMDGTLVDSMPYWHRLTDEYLELLNLTEDVLLDLKEQSETMSLSESAELFQMALGLNQPPEQIALDMGDLMDRHYQEDIPLRDGVHKFLEALWMDDVAMCVATLTPAPLARMCLERLGIADYFSFILCPDEIGVGKDQPEFFLRAAWEFGAHPAELTVFEDSHYAARAAKQAGCRVIGIYEKTNDEKWPQMQKICDATIYRWEEALRLM